MAVHIDEINAEIDPAQHLKADETKPDKKTYVGPEEELRTFRELHYRKQCRVRRLRAD